ncbi:Mth938-like domain-containing protein [Flexibacterium corallicola]|uniref:Mth938-like domain-containing protein n=1 Tax=Flexibacterium corallicola TaxID=3037259 RepID=UPI00286F37F4|nr:MTH938/NDUFAF3 family protein [Pseudovibrio sp. M1P-2-3]
MAKRGQKTIIRDAHFPQRAPIEAYGNGGFRFADMSHRGSLICVPDGMHGWDLVSSTDFNLDCFQQVLDQSDEIEILIIGTGTSLVPLPDEIRSVFREHGIMADVMATGHAVRTFNVLLDENRAVAAAILAVE